MFSFLTNRQMMKPLMASVVVLHPQKVINPNLWNTQACVFFCTGYPKTFLPAKGVFIFASLGICQCRTGGNNVKFGQLLSADLSRCTVIGV